MIIRSILILLFLVTCSDYIPVEIKPDFYEDNSRFREAIRTDGGWFIEFPFNYRTGTLKIRSRNYYLWVDYSDSAFVEWHWQKGYVIINDEDSYFYDDEYILNLYRFEF